MLTGLLLKCGKRLLVVGVTLLLAACATSTDRNSSEQIDVGPNRAELQARVEQLESEVSALEQHLSELRADNARLGQEQERWAKLEASLRAQVARLQLRLEQAQDHGGEVTPDSDAETKRLRSELSTVRQQLNTAEQTRAALQRQIATVKSDNAQQVYELESRLAQARAELTAAYPAPSAAVPVPVPGPDVQPGIDPGSGQSLPITRDDVYFVDKGDTDPPQATVVKVFYGTNRAVLDISLWHYASPFVLPAGFLLMLFAVPKAVRAIIRTYLHRVTINLFRVGLLLGTIWFGFSAVHTATQRWQYAHALPLQYGTERLNAASGELPYALGQVDVSIPPTHVKGVVEKANFVYFEFRSDPAKHFVLSDIRELDDNGFNTLLKKRVQSSPQKDLFVFVHGFHNTFEDAAFRTAQIAHDSGFKGAPVFYSWPSQGSVLGYTTDENNVDEAKQHLTVFLEQIKQHSGAERIHVVAHSMGSRALTSAVQAIGLKNDEPVFDEMVLAAPDLDAGTFKGIVPDLMQAIERLTLYASSKDTALAASRRVHGGDYQRAGESFPVPVTVVPVDTIDVSNVTSGHSYIADSGHILDDLNDILVNGRVLDSSNAIRRCASASEVACESPENWYWQLR